MKKFSLAFLLLFSVQFSMAQLPVFDWVFPVWGVSSVQGHDIAVDKDLNVIGVGDFQGNVDVMGDTSQINLTTIGVSDGYITKHDQNGILKWAFAVGSSTADGIFDVATDDNGNIYCAGFVTGNADPGVGMEMLNTTSEAFYVAKYDSLGNFIWLRNYAGVNIVSISIDASSDVLVSGFFNGTFDFDLSSGVFELSCPVNLRKDMFASKLDNNGNFIWAKQFPHLTWSNPAPYSVKSDDSGNIYLAGNYRDTLDADPDVGTHYLIPEGGVECFIIKLSETGDYIWSHSVGSSGNDELMDLTVMSNQDIFIVGNYPGTIDLDPTSGVQMATSAGSADIFVTRLSNLGDFVWSHSIGGVEFEEAFGVDVDQEDNVYISGTFRDVVDFDPGPGISTKSAIGNFNNSMYILSLDESGQFRFVQDVKSTMSNGFIVSRELEIDSLDNIHICGNFSNTIDFNPDSTAEYLLTHVGTYKSYKYKLSQCYSRDTLNESGCNSYISPSGKYIWENSGIYNDTIFNYLGCDSILLIDLSIEHTDFTDTVVACDSFVWIDGNTYLNNTDSAIYLIVNPQGCDSLATLNLTLTNSTSNIDAHIVCDSFTWIDGITYTSSNNTATHVITNSAGCDSLVQLNLTIDAINTSVMNSEPLLTAVSGYSSYQWLDCQNNFAPILGETNFSYTALSNGEYAVEITNNGCTDTSSCYSIANIGLIETEHYNWTIAPNPTEQIVTVQFEKPRNATVEIMDVAGRTLFKNTVINESIIKCNLTGESGIYFLKITSNNIMHTASVLKL